LRNSGTLGLLGGKLLLLLLSLVNDALHVILHGLDRGSLVGHLSLELSLESGEARDLPVNEFNTFGNVTLALGEVLFSENGANKFVNISVFGQEVELGQNHIVFVFLFSHSLLAG
jgi:hypothetical protein